MARVTVEDCIDKVDSPYELVLVAKERATQLNSGLEPTLDRDNDKNTVIALREIAEETIKVPDLTDAAVYKLRKHVEQIDDSSEDEDDVGGTNGGANTAGASCWALTPNDVAESQGEGKGSLPCRPRDATIDEDAGRVMGSGMRELYATAFPPTAYYDDEVQHAPRVAQVGGVAEEEAATYDQHHALEREQHREDCLYGSQQRVPRRAREGVAVYRPLQAQHRPAQPEPRRRAPASSVRPRTPRAPSGPSSSSSSPASRSRPPCSSPRGASSTIARRTRRGSNHLTEREGQPAPDPPRK